MNDTSLFLVDFNIVKVCIFSIFLCFLIPSPLSNPIGTIPSAPAKTGKTAILMYHKIYFYSQDQALLLIMIPYFSLKKHLEIVLFFFAFSSFSLQF